MKLRISLLAAVSSLALVGALAAPAGATTVTFAVGNDHVQCNTLSGTIGFATALKISGPSTGANTTTVKGALAGCTDTDNGSVAMFTGTLAATVHTTGGTSCTGIAGISNNTATSRITWKPATGQAFTPTVLVGLKQTPVSDVTFTQTNGGTYSVATGNGPWTGTSYGEFSLGTVYGTNPPAVAAGTDFTGGDGGVSGWLAGVLQQDALNIFTQCLGKGVKALSFGIGAINMG